MTEQPSPTKCDACRRMAQFAVLIPRGPAADPARFRLCERHSANAIHYDRRATRKQVTDE